MEKLDDEAASKFISALTKSVQTLCHGFLDFHTGVEIIGYINLNVDKGSKLHYVLEEKVCKNEENSTLFISNSFQAQNQKQDKTKGKDSDSVPSGSAVARRSNSTDNGESSRVSSAISSISTALSRSHEKSRVESTSGAKDAADTVHSRTISNTTKRKASDDLGDVRSAKSSHMRSSPSPVSHFMTHSQSPHRRGGRTSPVDSKPSVSELRGEDTSSTVLPQTAGIGGDSAGDLGVNLAGSVLERVDDHSNSDLPDRDDSDGDLEVTFIKEEYVEGEQSSCQFENSTGQQFVRGTNRRASSTDNMPDASLYPVSMHPSASATYVPGAQDMASGQQYGPSTSQPGASGVRGLGRYRRWHRPEMSSTSALDLTRNVRVPTSRRLSTSDTNARSQEDTRTLSVTRATVVSPTFSTNRRLQPAGSTPGARSVSDSPDDVSPDSAHFAVAVTSWNPSVTGEELQVSLGYAGSVSSDISKYGKRQSTGQWVASKRRNTTDNPIQGSSIKNLGEFKCRYCNVPPYKHKGSLKRHIKLFHMNQPVFRCHICSMGFMYKDHYIGHLNKHFNKATFQCTHCPKKFIYKGDMYNHRKKCHSGSADSAVDPLPLEATVVSEETETQQEGAVKEETDFHLEDSFASQSD